MLKDRKFLEKIEAIAKSNQSLKPGEKAKQLSVADLNGEVVAIATGEHRPAWQKTLSKLRGESAAVEKKQELVGYDYDGVFPLLVRYLTPRGVRGFVLAALMGAVVSSLAAMLNAASTIFTMDVYKEYISKSASQRALVLVGRLCVPVAVLIGCFIAPELARPEYQGAFHFIQEFQGYISPGILTVFLFGLFVHRTPRVCGSLGLVLCPIIYGALHLFWGDLAFLNRMAITVAVLSVLLGLITLVAPLKEPVTLPVQTKIALDESKGAKIWGIAVVLATVALYAIFF